MDNATGDWSFARGGLPDGRPNDSDPYSAASYTAQYGIPIEDARKLVEASSSHGEVRRAIYERHLSDPEFRTASLHAVTRPFKKEWSEEEQFRFDIVKTGEGTAKQIAERLGGTPPVKPLDHPSGS